MKWFDNWVLRRAKHIRCRQETVYEIDRAVNNIASLEKSRDTGSIGASRHRMNFIVYRANGGMMVEYNRYDERKDQHHCDLHIVQESENLGEALAKIITFENLKL